jgi:hypothetical protein
MGAWSKDAIDSLAKISNLGTDYPYCDQKLRTLLSTNHIPGSPGNFDKKMSYKTPRPSILISG